MAYTEFDANRPDDHLFIPSINTPDNEILPNKMTVDAHARHLERTNAHVRAAIEVKKDGIAVNHYILNSKPNIGVLKFTSTRFTPEWENEFQEEVEARFRNYVNSPSNFADATGRSDFTALMREAVHSFSINGETIAIFGYNGNPSRPYGTTMQLVDPDRLSTPTGMINNPQIRGGVEYDKDGVVVAYHIRDTHPSEYIANKNSWTRIPCFNAIGLPQIVHIYDRNRPGQSRGISSLVAALSQTSMLARVQRFRLQEIMLKCMYSVSVESDLPTAEIVAALGQDGLNSNEINEIVGKFSAAVSATNLQLNTVAEKRLSDNVRIAHMAPGTRLKANALTERSPIENDVEKSLLRQIASAFGVAFEEMSRDFSDVNFASSRVAIGLSMRSSSSLKKRVTDILATSFYRAWLVEGIMRNKIKNVPSFVRSSWILDRENFDALSNCSWIGAGAPVLDELKEAKAAELRILSGISTLEEECARHGRDWREVAQQRRREIHMLAECDLPGPHNGHIGNPKISVGGASALSAIDISAIAEAVAELLEDKILEKS